MRQPEKWRDTANPFSLPFKNFTLSEVLGYPHAGNDVFYATGLLGGEVVTVFIKAERQDGADIANEVAAIRHIERFGDAFPYTPEIIEFSLSNPRFIITREAVGERLSVIAENDGGGVSEYLYVWGATLARFHKLPSFGREVGYRKFFDTPSSEYFAKCGTEELGEMLRTMPKGNESHCFVHGDFHYANVLWAGKQISCVVDYELSGDGVREFDMAWACFLRPSQRFLNTKGEVETFLSGYGSVAAFDRAAFNRRYAQIAALFCGFGEADYRGEVTRLALEVAEE